MISASFLQPKTAPSSNVSRRFILWLWFWHITLCSRFHYFTFFSGDVESGTKLHSIPGGRKGTEGRHVGHTAHILCMAISSDGKYLVSIVIPSDLISSRINTWCESVTTISPHLFRPLETWTNWSWYGRQRHVNICITSQDTKVLCRYVSSSGAFTVVTCTVGSRW